MESIDKRNFLLNLSPLAGQMYAAASDFIPPAIDGQLLERADVSANWVKLQRSGMGEVVQHSAYWAVELMRQPWWNEAFGPYLYSCFVAAMTSNLFLLKESGTIQFAHDPVTNIAFWDEDKQDYVAYDPTNYSYKDIIGHLDFEPDLGVPSE